MLPELIDKIIAMVPESGQGDGRQSPTKRFKRDLIEFFEPLHLHRCVEVSSLIGQTTYVLSHIFDEVYFVEYPDLLPRHWEIAKNGILKDRDNIIPTPLDVYKDSWPFKDVDVFFIDCAHVFPNTCQDIDNAKRLLKPDGYIIFHDWGLPLCGEKGVQRAIVYKKLPIVKYIGERVLFNEADVFQFTFTNDADFEGVITHIKHEGG